MRVMMPIIEAVRRLVNQKSGPIGCVVKKSDMGRDRCCFTDIAVMSGPLPLVLQGRRGTKTPLSKRKAAFSCHGKDSPEEGPPFR